MNIVEIADILNKKIVLPIIDVRSEGEFFQGRIPSINIPLLDNEERKLVGTCYKERGNEAAVLLGYELVGGKFATKIKEIKKRAPTKKLILHCWRGGLRSRIVGQLLENSGFDVYIIKGGYKSFRRWVLGLLEETISLNVVGGLTGSGKTELLHLLLKAGEQIIDLEALACHKGSAFGGIEQPPQPTQEQFENNLAFCIKDLDKTKNIWIEDESRKIGNLSLPLQIWEAIRAAILYEIEVSYEDRLNRILNEYATLPREKLVEKTTSLKKRLGDKHLNEILEFLNNGEMKCWAVELLNYYDKNYIFAQNKRSEEKRKKINLKFRLNASDFLNQK